jgi:hypothetical protein
MSTVSVNIAYMVLVCLLSVTVCNSTLSNVLIIRLDMLECILRAVWLHLMVCTMILHLTGKSSTVSLFNRMHVGQHKNIRWGQV